MYQMYKKTMFLLVILSSSLVLMACNDKETLEGTWEWISEGDIEGFLYIEDDIASIREPLDDDIQKYKLLSSSNEDIHTFSFVDLNNNQTALDFTGYFDNKDTFMTIETSDPDYGFQLSRITDKEIEEKEKILNNERIAKEKEKEEREKQEELEREREELEELEMNKSAEVEEVYRMSCASCHGADLSGAVGPSLLNLSNRLTEEDIIQIIKDGKGAMPGGLVNQDEAVLLSEWLIEQ